MATQAELLEKKRGILEARKRLLDRERSLFATGENAPSLPTGLTRAALQGATFGFSDEIGSGIGAAITAPFVDESVGDLYDEFQFKQKLGRERFGNKYPKSQFTAEIGGGIAQGGGLLNASRHLLRNVPSAVRLGAVGATEGALFGAGTAEPGQRLKGAGIGAGIGAGGALVAGPLFAVGGMALRPVARKLGEALFDTPRGKASRIIRDALEADDITPDEALVLLRNLGKQGTLADLGENLTRAGRVAASQSGPGAATARRFLDRRQQGQQRRLLRMARNASGSNDFDRSVIDIVNGAETKAAPLYDEAYSTVVDVTPVMQSLLTRPAMKGARRRAATILQNEGYSDQIIHDVTDVRYLDAIKRALDDDIRSAYRGGNTNQGRVLTALKKDFLEQVDSQVPAYAQARQIFSGEASIRDAAGLGRSILKPSTDPIDMAEIVQQMGESELQAFRTGVLRNLADSLSGTAETRNVAKKFVETPKFRGLMRLAFPDQEAFDRFLRTAQAESRFSETRNTVLGGSPTARIQADREAAAGGIIPRLIDSIASPAQGIANAMQAITHSRKLTPEVLDEMTKILFDPKVIPTKVRPSKAVNIFDIPSTNPTVFSGRVGGGVGSQQQSLAPLIEMMITQPRVTGNQ